MNGFYLLRANNLPGDIDIHSDMLSVIPSALSRKRALKAGRERQEELLEKRGPSGCILCNPGLKPPGSSQTEVIIQNRCADFINDFPYLPGDQRVIFLWNDDKEIRERFIHRIRLSDLGQVDLLSPLGRVKTPSFSWLLLASLCILRG